MQRLAGCFLTGATERVIIFCWGAGANGKTTLVETWRGVLGTYAVHTPMSTLMARRDAGIPNDVARFPGARLVTAAETEPGQRFAAALVKYLTGGDRQIARFLFKEYFEFDPTYKLVILGNEKPEIQDRSQAMWDRLKLVPFTQRIPEAQRVERYHDWLLRDEGAGILAWMVAGCRAYAAEGLNPPAVVQAATAEYRSEQDRLSDFLADCCAVGAGLSQGAADLYAAYKHWCQGNNEAPLTHTAFGRDLGQRGFATDPKATTRRRRLGLQLKENWARWAERAWDLR